MLISPSFGGYDRHYCFFSFGVLLYYVSFKCCFWKPVKKEVRLLCSLCWTQVR